MQKKKKSTKPQKEETLIKIAGAIGTIAGKIANKKDHLIAVATNAIDSVKKVVDNIKSKKRPAVKAASKKIARKKVSKIVKPAIKSAKKSALLKKASATKKVVKKPVKNALKKNARKSLKKTS